MSKVIPDSILDVKGYLCPMPTVKTKVKIETMQVGEVLEIIATDPATKVDMPAWCEATDHEFIEFYEDGEEVHLFIKKTHEGAF